MKNAKIFVFPFFFTILIAIPIYAEDYLNPLTYSIADKRYCRIGENCSTGIGLYNPDNITLVEIGGIHQVNQTWLNATIDDRSGGVGGNINDTDISPRNINASGNVTATNLFGFLNFSWITNWDFTYIYNGIKDLIQGDFYNKTEADDRYCTTCGGSTGSNRTLLIAPECLDAPCNTLLLVNENI